MPARQVQGEVVRGQGLATNFVADPLFEQVLGTLHKGTINVLVSDPNAEHWIVRQVIDPRNVRAAGRLHFCPCTLEGQNAFIISSWHPGATYPPEVRHQGHTLIEIVAELRIPRIAYGSRVTLAYDPQDRQHKPV